MTKADIPSELAKREALIESLKNALVQRDLRIGQLELMLSKVLVNSDLKALSEVEQTLLPPPPMPASHRLSPHISAETKGLYVDGWTAPSALLVFHPGVESGEYHISFWLPRDAASKQLVLTPNSGESVELDLIPNKNVTYALQVPSDGLSPAVLKLSTSKFKSPSDSRELGVVIAKVIWVWPKGKPKIA
jgi:hypothetical protein